MSQTHFNGNGAIGSLPEVRKAVTPLETIAKRQRDFSLKAFGPGKRTKGVLAHIRKELDEIAADPEDISEWIDVMILAMDGALRHGATPESIAQGMMQKILKNEKRDWPDWREVGEDKPIEHVRGKHD